MGWQANVCTINKFTQVGTLLEIQGVQTNLVSIGTRLFIILIILILLFKLFC